MDWMVKRSGTSYNGNEDGCVRLRGLPFECSKEEIAQFFTGLEIVPNGITLLTDYSGRSSGEAYVQFANREVAERALEKHREKIGHRYIEIFRSSLSEISGALGFGGPRGPLQRGGSSNFGSRPGPYDRGDRFGNNASSRFPQRPSRNFKGANLSNTTSNWVNLNGGGQRPAPIAASPAVSRMNNLQPLENLWGNTQNHCIHMRGLPFKASEMDIAEFFDPVQPVSINISTDPSGRPSGEADVTFASHEDAIKAMSKDKTNMSHRYIELFLNSSGPSSIGGGSPGKFRR